ncbi:MAG: RidA family protein [Rhizobiaceae bacterium]|nr:MAG: RidA family protein [Rhizobiaceae bacterium]
MLEVFNPPNLMQPFGAFSNAALAPAGRLLFISGQVATDPEGRIVGENDIAAQTRQALSNIDTLLRKAGAGFEDVVSVTVFLKDMQHLDAVHEVRREFFKPPYPASTLVQIVSLVDPRMLIEINAVAVVPVT